MTSSIRTAFVTGLHRSMLLAELTLMQGTLMARDWVKLDGTHLDADLVSEEAGMLVLRSGNALPFKVPLQQFGDSDWLYVWNWMHTQAMHRWRGTGAKIAVATPQPLRRIHPCLSHQARRATDRLRPRRFSGASIESAP